MPTPEQIYSYLIANIECTHLEVNGDGQHFFVKIVADEFNGLRSLARQRRVYRALGGKMDDEIHALSMETFTPQEWSAKQSVSFKNMALS